MVKRSEGNGRETTKERKRCTEKVTKGLGRKNVKWVERG